MANKAKVVNITKEDKDKDESFGKDKKGNIVKLEKESNESREKRAASKRIIAIVLWVLAIACEVVGILRLKTDSIKFLSNVDDTYFLVGCLILDLAFLVPGSLLWKKANHIDPASEKQPVKFWLWNNLGMIISVIAFLPIIILTLTDKNASKKTKTVVSIVAAVALAIGLATGHDWNPVSQEELLRAEQEVEAVSESGNVYWAPTSKKYHVDPECPAFSQSETIYEGTVKQAFEKGLTEPCRRCIPELEDDHEHVEE